jgi:hypothetical protein
VVHEQRLGRPSFLDSRSHSAYYSMSVGSYEDLVGLVQVVVGDRHDMVEEDQLQLVALDTCSHNDSQHMEACDLEPSCSAETRLLPGLEVVPSVPLERWLPSFY